MSTADGAEKLGNSRAIFPRMDPTSASLGGVRLPEITVPLATYASWNLRDPSIGAPDQRVSFAGSYLASPNTAADRQKAGDPRKAIAERYSGREDHMMRYASAVDNLIKERWVLAEDRAALLDRGEQEWTTATK